MAVAWTQSQTGQGAWSVREAGPTSVDCCLEIGYWKLRSLYFASQYRLALRGLSHFAMGETAACGRCHHVSDASNPNDRVDPSWR
jgi:cytochrome c553